MNGKVSKAASVNENVMLRGMKATDSRLDSSYIDPSSHFIFNFLVSRMMGALKAGLWTDSLLLRLKKENDLYGIE